jgi:hypothetical protein
MLAGKSEDVKRRIKEECDEVHQEAMAAYEEKEDGLPSVDAEIQQEYVRFL